MPRATTDEIKALARILRDIETAVADAYACIADDRGNPHEGVPFVVLDTLAPLARAAADAASAGGMWRTVRALAEAEAAKDDTPEAPPIGTPKPPRTPGRAVPRSGF